MRAFTVAFVYVCALAGPARAQDLFEVEVFPAETTATGETELEVHANGLPGRAVPLGVDSVDHPLHASIEISHGLTDWFELGVFIQTAPIARGNQSPFAGGHVRPKIHVPMPNRVPLDVSLVAEYGINRTAFDENRQTIEIVPIVEHRSGRLTMVANPEWSMSFKGPDAAMAPKLSLAAKLGWQATPTIAAAAEYYWKSEALKHFNPTAERHHFLMPAMDIKLSPVWDLNLGAGHCLTDLDERWVLKSIIGYSFR